MINDFTFFIMNMKILKHVTPDTTRKATTIITPLINSEKSSPVESM